LMSNGTKVWKIRRKKMLAKIGTWNIRTMLVGGKMEEVAREMLAYKIKILALQELRWAGEGRIDKEKYTLLYAGEEKQGRNGTGFMISREMRDKIKQFKRVSGRISCMRIENSIANITL